MYLGMWDIYSRLGWSRFRVGWEVWFLALDPWDCLPGDPHFTALSLYHLYSQQIFIELCIQYCMVSLHIITYIVQVFHLFGIIGKCNMEIKGREALKIGLKKILPKRWHRRIMPKRWHRKGIFVFVAYNFVIAYL